MENLVKEAWEQQRIIRWDQIQKRLIKAKSDLLDDECRAAYIAALEFHNLPDGTKEGLVEVQA